MWCSGQKTGFGREDLSFLFGACFISLGYSAAAGVYKALSPFQGKRGIPTAFPFLNEC